MVCMQTSAHGILNSTSLIIPRSRDHGFTLLELLVVIVIISILFSLTTLAIRTNSPEELIETEARRLDRLLQLALEEAILKGEEYGLEFNRRGYRFLHYVDYVWQPMDNDRELHPRELPLDMEIEVEIEKVEIEIGDEKGKEKDNSKTEGDNKDEQGDKLRNKTRPQIFLLSSGEITPEFSARFLIPGIATSYLVSATEDGEHKAEISAL